MTSQANRTAVRLMSSPVPEIAYRQLAELARRGGIVCGMIIAELDDGHIHIIGQRAKPPEMAHLLLAAAKAIEQVAEIDPDSTFNAPPAERPRIEPEVRQALDPAPRAAPGSLAAEWDSLSAAIFRDGTSAVQRSEMRRAFYCGVQALMSLMTTAMDPGDEETAADIARLQSWQDELLIFAASLVADRA